MSVVSCIGVERDRVGERERVGEGEGGEKGERAKGFNLTLKMEFHYKEGKSRTLFHLLISRDDDDESYEDFVFVGKDRSREGGSFSFSLSFLSFRA